MEIWLVEICLAIVIFLPDLLILCYLTHISKVSRYTFEEDPVRAISAIIMLLRTELRQIILPISTIIPSVFTDTP